MHSSSSNIENFVLQFWFYDKGRARRCIRWFWCKCHRTKIYILWREKMLPFLTKKKTSLNFKSLVLQQLCGDETKTAETKSDFVLSICVIKSVDLVDRSRRWSSLNCRHNRLSSILCSWLRWNRARREKLFSQISIPLNKRWVVTVLENSIISIFEGPWCLKSVKILC